MSQSPAAGPQQARPGLGGELHSFGHNLAQPQTGAQVSADDPMSLLGGVGAGSASRTGGGTMNIDDWLGTGTGSAGTPAPAQGPGRLPTDHVHDLNLPLRLPQGAATPAAQPLLNSIGAPATQPFPTGGGNADPWGALESGWNVAASAGAATAAKAPEPAGKSTYPSPAAPQELDFDALFGGGSSADPFQDSSWFGPGQQSPAHHAADLPARPAVGSAAPSQAAISPAAPRHDAAPAAAGLAGGTGHVQAASAFARGLGLAQTPALDYAAWERVGEAVKLIVSAIADAVEEGARIREVDMADLGQVSKATLAEQEQYLGPSTLAKLKATVQDFESFEGDDDVDAASEEEVADDYEEYEFEAEEDADAFAAFAVVKDDEEE
jgi:hypothetical protein